MAWAPFKELSWPETVPGLLLAAVGLSCRAFYRPGQGRFRGVTIRSPGAGPGPGFTFSNSGPNGNTHTLINNIAGSGAAVSRLLVMPAWFSASEQSDHNGMEQHARWMVYRRLPRTGVSLLVTLDNATGRIRFGDVANDTGLAPLDPTRSYSGVLETRTADDLVPFLDLGSFAAGDAKLFNLVYTYHFGDGKSRKRCRLHRR